MNYQLTKKYILINGDKILREHINKIDRYHMYIIPRVLVLHDGEVLKYPDPSTNFGVIITAYNKSKDYILKPLDNHINEYVIEEDYKKILEWYKGE